MKFQLTEVLKHFVLFLVLVAMSWLIEVLCHSAPNRPTTIAMSCLSMFSQWFVVAGGLVVTVEGLLALTVGAACQMAIQLKRLRDLWSELFR